MTETPLPDHRRRRLRLLARSRHLLFVAFALALVASTWVLRIGEHPPWERILIALIPLAPVAAIIATYTILVRRGCFDEFGRRVLLEGCATVFIAGMPILLVYAMLRNADVGLPAMDWQAVFIAAALLWGLGVVVSLKRHQGYVNFTSRGVGGGAKGEP